MNDAADANASKPASGLLAIYLQDHHAGAVGGLELARRIAGQNSGAPEGAELARIADEIEADKEVLEELMDRLGVNQDMIKDRFAWGGEKLGRLKRNGTWLSYSPLSRVVELEGLMLGVSGKLGLWEALEATLGPSVDGIEFGSLAARAADQRDRIARLRIGAAAIAFTDDASS